MNRDSLPNVVRARSGLRFEALLIANDARAPTRIRSAMAQAGVLGGICHGAPLPRAEDLHDAAASPLQLVPTPPLTALPAPAALLLRLLRSDRPVRGGSDGAIAYRTDGDFVFGALSTVPPVGQGDALRESSRSLYEQIFGFLARLDPPARHRLWRIWNYMSDINGNEGALERYRHFNHGRAQAFAELWAACAADPADPGAAHRAIPAACGIGTPAPPAGAPSLLSISFLAGRRDFAQIENPRQVSAFAYPPDYGAARPLFSRAILGSAGTAPQYPSAPLFISGTASIVGHRTVHKGDVVEQCHESLRNIAAIVGQANDTLRLRGETSMAMADLDYLVYLRIPRDLAAVQQVVTDTVGSRARVHYVQADICRDDLLVEIEATRLCPCAHG